MRKDPRRPGQPWRPPLADNQNAWDDAALHHEQTRLGPGGVKLPSPIPTDLVGVKNVSGADMELGEVVQLGSLLTYEGSSPVSPINPIILEADTLDSNGCETTYGILTRPLKNNETAERACQMSGVCRALIDIDDADHNAAWTDSGESVLQSGFAGNFKIVWKPAATTGEALCVVLFDCCNLEWRAKVNDAYGISNGGSGTVRLYSCGVDQGSNYDVTAYYDWSTAGVTIPDATEIRVRWDCGCSRWQIIDHEC